LLRYVWLIFFLLHYVYLIVFKLILVKNMCYNWWKIRKFRLSKPKVSINYQKEP